MISAYFSRSGLLPIESLPQGQRHNAQCLTETVLLTIGARLIVRGTKVKARASLVHMEMSNRRRITYSIYHFIAVPLPYSDAPEAAWHLLRDGAIVEGDVWPGRCLGDGQLSGPRDWREYPNMHSSVGAGYRVCTTYYEYLHALDLCLFGAPAKMGQYRMPLSSADQAVSSMTKLYHDFKQMMIEVKISRTPRTLGFDGKPRINRICFCWARKRSTKAIGPLKASRSTSPSRIGQGNDAVLSLAGLTI